MKILYRSQDGDKTADATASLDQPLLDTVEAAGIKLPFGCRGGSCGVCRIQITKGLGLFAPRGFIEEDTASRCKDPDHVRLACQARIDDSQLAHARDAEIELDVPPEVPPFEG